MGNHENVSSYSDLFLIELQFNIFLIIWNKTFYSIIADNSETDNETPLNFTLSKVPWEGECSWACFLTWYRQVEDPCSKNKGRYHNHKIVSLKLCLWEQRFSKDFTNHLENPIYMNLPCNNMAEKVTLVLALRNYSRFWKISVAQEI